MRETSSVRHRSRFMQFPDRSNALLGQERPGELIGLRVRQRHIGMFFRRLGSATHLRLRRFADELGWLGGRDAVTDTMQVQFDPAA
jgi:hypothetical protein